MTRHIRLGLGAALALGSVASAVAGWTGTNGSPFVPGLLILGLAAVAVGFVGSRWVALLAAVAAALVLGRLLLVGGLGRGDALEVGARSAQLGGCVMALLLAAAMLATPGPFQAHSEATSEAVVRPKPPRAWAWPQVVAMFVLATICAEQLAAYDDTTGHPLQLLFGVTFFGALYGGPAVIVREVARRRGWGWPSMILLAAAFSLVQAGIVDQSLFSDSYRDIEGWQKDHLATLVALPGISAYQTLSFLVGHVAFSFCAPIAVVEAFRPSTMHRSWLRAPGLVVVTVLYLLIAGVILDDHLSSENSHASWAQLAGTIVVVALLVAAAAYVGHGGPRSVQRDGARRRWPVVLVAFVFAAADTFAPPTWAGFAFSLSLIAIGVVLLMRAARRPDWGPEHAVAVATGIIFSRAVLAFTYFPLIGETSPERKYAHNVVMLLIVGAACAFGLRRTRPHTVRAAERPATA